MEEDVLDGVEHLTQKSEIKYPLNFEFKISSLANDFTITDANANGLAYVRQKMFKLKEAIMVYANQDKKELLYKINADRIIDFNASYSFTNQDEVVFGRIGRKGAKSLLKAHYEIFNTDEVQEFLVQEENPWSKLFDAMLGEIPVVGIFTGYLFNPKYIIKNPEGDIVARLSKEPSFWGRKFTLNKIGEFNDEQGERMLLGLMMMSLLERRRG